ncbi:MAG: sulfatase-like hydrolase/transferase [Pirellula sp.]
MSRNLTTLLVCFLTLFSCALRGTASGVEVKKPNLLIFYADDLGYGECGVYGCKDIPTPNIDAIAKNGIKFTQGYVAATYCSPSRAGLMTGRYPTRFGHEFNAITRQYGLSLNETTLPDRLKKLGYATCAIGKWHLGQTAPYHPTKRGFDEFFGTLANTPFFHPTNFIDSRKSNEVQRIDSPDFYTTDQYSARALQWMSERKGEPWFLYLPFNAQHAPLEAPQKYLDRFPNLTDKRKIFAAMMSAMDDAIGNVMSNLRRMGQEENTLVFFIADNGGPTQSTTSNNGPLRGFKMTTFEGGPRVPFLAQWKGTFPAGVTYDFPVMNLDVLPTILTAAGSGVDVAWKLDGVDLSTYVTGKNKARPHQTMYWRYGEQWAVRDEDWKLVVSKGGSGKPELYHLSNDIGESKDLSAKEPGRVVALQKLYDAWSAEQAEPTVKDNANPNRANRANRKNQKV